MNQEYDEKVEATVRKVFEERDREKQKRRSVMLDRLVSFVAAFGLGFAALIVLIAVLMVVLATC